MRDRTLSLDERLVGKLLRFLLVGGGGALVYAGLCTLLVERFPDIGFAISIGVHAMLIPVIYIAQSRVTFRNGGTSLAELLRYGLLQIVSITVSTGLLVRLVTDSRLVNLVVFMAIAATASVISFVVCNVLVFRAPGDVDLPSKPGPAATSDQ